MELSTRQFRDHDYHSIQLFLYYRQFLFPSPSFLLYILVNTQEQEDQRTSEVIDFVKDQSADKSRRIVDPSITLSHVFQVVHQGYQGIGVDLLDRVYFQQGKVPLQDVFKLVRDDHFQRQDDVDLLD